MSKSWFNKLKKGLSKTRENTVGKMFSIITKKRATIALFLD